MNHEHKGPECAQVEGAVPGSLGRVIIAVQQPLQRGTVTLMATPHMGQMARKPPVSSEQDSQPPGFLCVEASPGSAMVLQWAQSDP